MSNIYIVLVGRYNKVYRIVYNIVHRLDVRYYYNSNLNESEPEMNYLIEGKILLIYCTSFDWLNELLGMPR